MNAPTPSSSPSEETEMGLFDHLAELRKRLVISFGAVLGMSICAYLISAPVLEMLFEPFFRSFDQGQLIGTGPAEAFVLKLKVAIFVGLLFASPIIFLQLWLFIAPGLYEHERRMAIPFVAATTGLFLIGVAFCYLVVLPFAFDFFRDQYLSIGRVTPAIRMSEHLALVIQALLGFGIVFEMPVLAFLLARFGVIDHKMMIASGRYAVVLIFIASAILTPPDVLTQFLMAIPLLILYGLSIVIVKYAQQKPLE